MIQLTKERIDQLLTDRGGFTRLTIFTLLNHPDSGGPLPHWRQAITGKWISDEHWKRCLATVRSVKRLQPTLF